MAPATHKEAQAHLKRRTPITADYKASSACFDNLVAVATTVSLSLQPRIVCERKGLVQQPSSIVVQRRRWAYGGGSGIRTHDTVSRIHAFQACAFSHSAIPPRSTRFKADGHYSERMPAHKR